MNGYSKNAKMPGARAFASVRSMIDRKSSSPFRRRAWLLFAALLASSVALADTIDVPNGDFSDAGNTGSIGGVVGPDINNQLIANGPWHGSSFGILGLLARPTLSVSADNQVASISGLLSISGLGGLLNTGGWFSQQLVDTWQPGRFYVLSAELTTGNVLDLGLLTATNVGIGLTSGGSVVVSSTTADPEFLSLGLVEGNRHRLRFGWYADNTASGPIGIRLFNRPQGLAQANLLTTTTFSNVELEGRDIGQPVRVIIIPGEEGGTETGVGERFPGNFIAIVQDEDGDGVPGYEVTISAPEGDESASADLSSPSSDDPRGRTISALTDIDGVVTFDAFANQVAGCFLVQVNSDDPELTIESGVFHFRNVSDDPAQNSIFCNSFE